MGIVGVKKGGARAELGDDRPENARIETGTPASHMDGNSVTAESFREWSARARHDHLGERLRAGELAGEQPDLPLAAPPFAAGGDVNDTGRQAGRPPSRAISPSSWRSSARLNGLCR